MWQIAILTNPLVQLAYPPLAQEEQGMLDEFFVGEDNLTTGIIEAGHIGYVHIRTFISTIDDNDMAVMNRFFDDITGFEHLIIDIRGNGGGFIPFFDELIAGPLIDGQLIDHLYHFILGGTHNMAFATAARMEVLPVAGADAALDRTARIAEEFGLALPTPPPRMGDGGSNWNPRRNFLDAYAHYSDGFDYFIRGQHFIEPAQWREGPILMAGYGC